MAEDLFWRSAMSGGRATVAQRKGTKLARQAGDITATAPEGHALTNFAYIECKAYRTLGLDRFMWMSEGKIAPMWRDTVKQASLYQREPVLIAKQNGFPVLVIMNAYLANAVTPTPLRFHGSGISIMRLDDLTAYLFPTVSRLWLDAVPKRQSLPRVRTTVRR